MRSQVRIPSVTAAPTAVEAEFAALCNDAAKDNIAEAVGLSCHTTIAERIAKAVTKRKGYLREFTGEQVVRLAGAHAPLGEQVIAYIRNAQAQSASFAPITAEISKKIGADAVMIAQLNAALSDGRVDRQEAADLARALRETMAACSALVLRLDGVQQ